MTVIFQLTKIQNVLADYAVELASTDFDKVYSKNGAVQYEDYTVVYHPGTFHANSFRKLCINDYTTPVRHVTGNDQDYLRKIPRAVVQISALL